MNENEQLRENLRQVLAYCDELGYELGFAGVEAKQVLEHRDKQAEPMAVDHSGLIKRIDAAIERVTQGRGLMSIPADPRSDVDLVLSECKALLEGKNPPFWATDFHPAQPVQPAGAQGDPVGYQFRTRPVHHREKGWGSWEPCDKQLFDACMKIPVNNDLEFEVRKVYAEAPAVACSFPERDVTKPAEAQGLFRKFDVRRVDGSDAPGGKHHGCEYFVLDLDHDIHAPAAIRAYAQACNETHPQLSAELSERLGPQPAVAQEPVGKGETLRESLFREFPLLEDHGLDEVEHHCEWNIQQERKRLHALLNKPPAAAINEQLLEALKELMYARTDKAEGMADAAIAQAEATKGGCMMGKPTPVYTPEELLIQKLQADNALLLSMLKRVTFTLDGVVRSEYEGTRFYENYMSTCNEASELIKEFVKENPNG